MIRRTSAPHPLVPSALTIALFSGCHDADVTDDLTASTVAAQVAAPVPLRGRQLALGRAHGCSLDPDISGLRCWGDNGRGQTTIPTLRNPRFIAAGGDVTCALAGGGVSCWGDGTHGLTRPPRDLVNPTQVAVGEAHACALAGAGTVRCWGEDTAGQLQVPVVTGVRAIGAGQRHTCALTAREVVCWGDGALGQREVPALQNPTALAVGGTHACAIDGSRVVCWGGATEAVRDAPKVTAPTAIAAGATHTCAIDQGRVRCWGEGIDGLAPRDLTRPYQVAVGGSGGGAFACARHQQGVACWGDARLKQTAYDGAPLHLLYRGEAEIAAPAALIWDILLDLPGYPAWNPYTIAMKSTLQVGAPMEMTVKMNERSQPMTQVENIRVLDREAHKVCWGIDSLTPTLNSGERCQWLEPLPDGRVRYVTEDLIEGTLNPLVTALYGPDIDRGFKAVAAALKVRAEALAKGGGTGR